MTMAGKQGRIWIRLMKNNKSVRDVTIAAEREGPESALREALPPLDVSQPMWLPRHRTDWAEYAFTRFLPEHFVDSVPFDRMEISYIFPEGVEKPARRNRLPQEDA